MGVSLVEVAQQLKDSTKLIQLVYAFNGTGKTRLCNELKRIVDLDQAKSEDTELDIVDSKFIYYNAYTEDLFIWENNEYVGDDRKSKLGIKPNSFTDWIFRVQGQDSNISKNFKRYTDSRLTPEINAEFNEITFSYARGNEETVKNIKISKGEESNYIWCVFFAVLQETISILEEHDDMQDETGITTSLKYVFIDDPVTSLDDNHLIYLAIDLAALVKKSCKLNVKFVITTHNPLFYNVLLSELNNDAKDIGYFRNKHFCKSRLDKFEDGTFAFIELANDSPFAYHLLLKDEIKSAITSGNLRKYHYNFLRNMYEKTAIFLGYKSYYDLLPLDSEGKPDPYVNRLININSHSKHSGEEVDALSHEEKDEIVRIFNHLIKNHKFFSEVKS